MRELSFIVNGKRITQDPNCDFSGMFPGREKHVIAKFVFSPEWKNFIKVAAFWSIAGAEYPPQALIDGETCMIPVEALNRPAFNVQILGKHRTDKIETNKLTIYQRGGKV
jgi:hypothetical protein